jgi:hypothetical protein
MLVGETTVALFEVVNARTEDVVLGALDEEASMLEA